MTAVPRARPAPPMFDVTAPGRRRQVAATARRTRLPGHAPADVRQELTLRLVAEAPRYDPARGSPGRFAATVLRTARAGLVRRARARKRGADVRAARLATDPPARGDGGHLAMAVGEVLGRLPADLQRLADHLRAGGTVAELARGGDAHRATWHRRLHRLRAAFAAAGFAPATPTAEDRR